MANDFGNERMISKMKYNHQTVLLMVPSRTGFIMAGSGRS
jgi:hypothetical protein